MLAPRALALLLLVASLAPAASATAVCASPAATTTVCGEASTSGTSVGAGANVAHNDATGSHYACGSVALAPYGIGLLHQLYACMFHADFVTGRTQAGALWGTGASLPAASLLTLGAANENELTGATSGCGATGAGVGAGAGAILVACAGNANRAMGSTSALQSFGAFQGIGLPSAGETFYLNAPVGWSAVWATPDASGLCVAVVVLQCVSYP